MKKEHVITVQNKKTISLNRFIKTLKRFEKTIKEKGYNPKDTPVFIGDVIDDFNINENNFNKNKGLEQISLVKVDLKETKIIAVLKGA